MVQARSSEVTLEEIRHIYGLEIRAHRIGDFDLRVAQVANVDAMIADMYPGGVSCHGDSPVWMITWPAAFGLAEYLLGNVQVKGLQVLELGCGTAAAGVALSRAGARVTCTDCDVKAIEMALYNAQLNGCRSLRACTLDWYHPDADSCFDVIIGSEIAYFERSFMPLLDVIKKHLKPDGKAFLSDQYRPQMDVFIKRCEDEGFSCHQHKGVVHLPEQSHTVRITVIASSSQQGECRERTRLDDKT